MGRTPKLTTEVKLELLEQYFAGGSPSKLSEEYGINVRTIEQWANRYRKYGSEAFRSRQGNNSKDIWKAVPHRMSGHRLC